MVTDGPRKYHAPIGNCGVPKQNRKSRAEELIKLVGLEGRKPPTQVNSLVGKSNEWGLPVP